MIKRLFLMALLLTLAVLLTPSLRERAQPRIDIFREAAGERLEGPMAPVLTPYRELKTRSEMARLVSELVSDRNVGRTRPAPDEFQEFVRRRLGGEYGLDHWGSPYIIYPDPDSLAVISPGPDLEYHTDDDLVEKIRYAAPPRRYRR